MTTEVPLVIIGAGASGLACAARLVSKSYDKFVVLEARDRIGGRVNSVKIGRKLLELGAQWIHGEENNVAFDIAKKYNLIVVEDDDDSSSGESEGGGEFSELAEDWRDVMFVTSEGVALPEAVSKKIGLLTARMEHEAFDGPSEDVSPSIEIKCAGDNYVSCVDAILASEPEFSGLLKEWRAPYMDWLQRYMNSVDGSDSWTQVSPTDSYKRCPGNPHVALNFKKGFVAVLENLKRDVPSDKIHLKKEVMEIDWSSDSRIQVKCKDGSTYVCERCLVTLPLGVLRDALGPQFKPPLPERKVKTIQSLGFGVVDKIFIKFPHRWWPDSAEDGFSFFWTDDPEPQFEGWPRSILGFYADQGNRSVLCGWICGDGARQMESKPLAEVEKVCIQLLRKFTARLGFKVPDPVQTIRSTWYSDPHAKGSYSFRTVTCDEEKLGSADLAAPLPSDSNPRLLFAGEATHSSFYSTVHGAIETGYREADRLLKQVKPAT